MFVKDNRLATLLDAVNCKELHLFTKELNHEETEALVRAMTSRVEILHLAVHFEFHMDYETFSKYKGDGKCTEVHIIDCPDYHLSPLLDSVNCKELHLFTGSKDLCQDETEALVRAMTSRVEIVHLGLAGSQVETGQHKETVTLDFDTLKMYRGDGKCTEVHCNGVYIGWSEFVVDFDDDDHVDLITSSDGYIRGRKNKWLDDEDVETWAEQMNWDLKVENQDGDYLLSRK